MNIWVDADSVPVRVREIIIKACRREGVEAYFVANRKIPLEEASEITFIIVPATEGSADAHILAEVQPEDLVVTRDIPLAAEEKQVGREQDLPRGRAHVPKRTAAMVRRRWAGGRGDTRRGFRKARPGP